MGLIITDEHVLENGMTLTNYYVNIDNIKIRKSADDFKYFINADTQLYVNKSMRDLSHVRLIKKYTTGVGSNVLTNVQEQLYTELKTQYTSYTDDL
tara:strand:- start:185 stop:472 length:288 start_codon:yes stop_codon:yes gene_type:complete